MNPISPQAADAVEAAQQFTVNRPEACLIPISVQFPQRTANTAAIQSLHSVSSNTSPAPNPGFNEQNCLHHRCREGALDKSFH